MLAAAGQSLRFARLALVVRREHENLKRRRRGLDFDDLIAMTRDLLREHPEVVAPSQESADALPIEFVLVDEFQDTDSLQGEILRLLERLGVPSGRLFVVGDVKQSIYRFRGAEPSIFRHWRAEFPEPGRLSLTENFRSVPGVIHFVNALFGECFRDLEPTDDGDGSGGSNPLLPIRHQDTCQPTVEFLWPAPEDEPGEARAGEAQSRSKRRPTSADDRGSLPGTATPRAAGRRLAGLRSGHECDASGAPRRHRLAVPGDDRPLALRVGPGRRRVRLPHDRRLGLLRPAGGPRRDQPAVGRGGPVRRGRAGRRSAESRSSASATRACSGWPTTLEDGGLTAGIHRLDEIAKLSQRDRRRLARALALLTRWREAKDHVPMAPLVARVLDESGFEAAVVCEFLGERKLANTRKIVRLARDFDRQGGFTLAEFVARLRDDLENEPREEQAATTDEASASIRLMSIHQAKGLEFPIVVLPDLARSASNRSPLVAIHPELGLVARPAEASPGSMANPEPNPPEPTADPRPEASPGRRTRRSKKRTTSRSRSASSTWRPRGHATR